MASIPASEPAAHGWHAFVAALSLRAIATTVVLAVGAAAVLDPIFMPSFVVLLARTLVLATVLLFAYAAGRAWPPRWLPRGLAPVLAVLLAAPPTTALIYLVVSGGVRPFVQTPERLSGFAWIAGMGMLLGLAAATTAVVRERLAQAEARALRLELEAAQARLERLRAQIEPHFLFNTLANVQALVEGGSPRAAEVLKSLIAYLRAAMPRLNDAAPTLGHELDLVRAYLALMQMRMPDRLAFAIDADDAPRHLPFPTLALLTLVENAVRHGIDPAEDGGRIEVGVRRDAGTLRLWVADTGVGMDPHAAPGTGLSNLRDRLHTQYAGRATLTLAEQAPHGVRAEITLPAP